MNKNYIAWIRGKLGKSNKFLNFATGVIKNKKGEILLQKRGGSGKWGLPDGALELGESYDQAAVREVFEETGLKVKVEDFLGVYSSGKYKVTHQNGDIYQPIVAAFYCKKIMGELKVDNKETLDLKYFSQKQLPKLYNNQHKDIILDAFKEKTSIWK